MTKSRPPLLVVATAPLVGEGVDLPDLDTLLGPRSHSGRMVQYRADHVVDGKHI